jgi:hypothetical protein
VFFNSALIVASLRPKSTAELQLLRLLTAGFHSFTRHMFDLTKRAELQGQRTRPRASHLAQRRSDGQARGAPGGKGPPSNPIMAAGIIELSSSFGVTAKADAVWLKV